MALTTIAKVRSMPFYNNTALYSDAFLNMLITDADAGIKKHTKRRLELEAFEQYLDGNEMPDLVLRQWPVLVGVTQVAAGSDGAVLPQATINVVTTVGSDDLPKFDAYVRATGRKPVIAVQVGRNQWTTVAYTGITATTFTGCSGGSGTLSSADGYNGVSQPTVWVDFQGFGGQRQPDQHGDGPYPDSSLLVLGGNYEVVADGDGGTTSERGLLRRTGGNGSRVGFVGGAWPGQAVFGGQGKLSAWRRPCWPRGDRNIKVRYSAGYYPVPADLEYAATSLVAYMASIMPAGALLSSESWGSYSYSLLQQGTDVPAIGSIANTLARYREISWGV